MKLKDWGCEKIPPVSGSFWSKLIKSFLEWWILLHGTEINSFKRVYLSRILLFHQLVEFKEIR